MGASIWDGSSDISSTANADNTYISQRFTATAGQTLFTITNFAYQIATGSLLVFINGVDQYIGIDFTETSNASFTLVTAAEVGDIVVVRGLIGSTNSASAADSASNAQISAAAALATYNSIVALSLPSLPLTVANGGTGSATAAGARTNLAAVGITDNIAVAYGGTGAATAAGARTNLSAVGIADVIAVAQGGTGSSTAATARTALSAVGTADVIAVAQGGTGSATALAAFNALSPTTTKGDLLLDDGTNSIRLAVGSNGKSLKARSTATSGVAWENDSIPFTSALVVATTLTASTIGYHTVAMTAINQAITLPDATTLTTGTWIEKLNNIGGYPVPVRDSAGTLITVVEPNGVVTLGLENIGSAAGQWSFEGTNLSPGHIIIDSSFTSTYTTTILKQFVAFDSNKSLHFLSLSSGFAAVAIDRTTGTVGTPVTVDATASSVPRAAFLITSTTAVIFYSTTTGTLIGVVISLSATTTLSVGTPSSTLTATDCGSEDFAGPPKIAQLATTLYLVSYATATGAGTTSVAAFQISGGTACNLGSAANIIAANNVLSSTITYALTATTGLVFYASGASPYTVSAVVISVTNANPPVCTVGSPAACAGAVTAVIGDLPHAVCALVQATKYLAAIGDTGNNRQTAVAITISAGTTVTWGTPVSVEATLVSGALQYVGTTPPIVSRYNHQLFTCTSTTALLSYLSSNVSEQVILTEAAGVVTVGAFSYGNYNRAALNTAHHGNLQPQGTTEFMGLVNNIVSSAGVSYPSIMLTPSKISGTTITQGKANIVLPLNQTADVVFSTRMSTGLYVLTYAGLEGCQMPVYKSNGDFVDFKGHIKVPNINNNTAATKTPRTVSSNTLVMLAQSGDGSLYSGATKQLRLALVEVVSS